MDSEKNPVNQPKNQDGFKAVFSLGKGMAIAAHIFGYIVGPLIILGGLGWWLDKTFETKPYITFVSILVAFIVTNVLVIKKTSSFFDKYKPKTDNHNEPKSDGKQ